MTVKILGGLVKGQSLFVPKGQIIRPTSVMLRRKIFDANQNLENWVFVDFCAGSGAVGIEAVSRGVNELYLVEKNPKVYALLSKNIASTQMRLKNIKFDVFIKSFKSDSLSWLLEFKSLYQNWSNEKKSQTIVFLDPPYEDKNLYTKFIAELYCQNKWFYGQFWVESDNQKGIDEKSLTELLSPYGEIKIYKHSLNYLICVD